MHIQRSTGAWSDDDLDDDGDNNNNNNYNYNNNNNIGHPWLDADNTTSAATLWDDDDGGSFDGAGAPGDDDPRYRNPDHTVMAWDVRAEEVGLSVLVLVLWMGAVALFINRWGKIRMLEPYQPKVTDVPRASVPNTAALTAAGTGASTAATAAATAAATMQVLSDFF